LSQDDFSRARFICSAAASSLLLAGCGASGTTGLGLGGKLAAKQNSRSVRKLNVKSMRKKVSFPQPRPDGTLPPVHREKLRKKRDFQLGDGGGGDGGGGTGGSGGTDPYDPSNADYSFSSDGFSSYSFDSSNYAETYDGDGDLVNQLYGTDTGYEVVDGSGTDFSMDMPAFPDDDIMDQSYAFTVDGGSITVEFSSSTDSGKASFTSGSDGKVYNSPPTSVTSTSTKIGDINFDGTGQSYRCQRARLWQSTVIAAIIVGGGVFVRYAPNAAAGTGGGIASGATALEQIRVSKEYLASIGCS
jgi:hypothetical protein